MQHCGTRRNGTLIDAAARDQPFPSRDKCEQRACTSQRRHGDYAHAAEVLVACLLCNATAFWRGCWIMQTIMMTRLSREGDSHEEVTVMRR